MKINTTPLAIVGMSCLFPKADDLQAYWANIKSGVDAITPIPLGSHWNPSDYFDADPKSPDHTYAQRGGFLSPVSFNPMEFGISPKDIEATDTTQLLSLLGAQQALVNAGYEAGSTKGRGYDRERTSVILGVTGALELVIPLGARLGHPHWRRALKDAGVEPNVAEDVVQRISDSYVGWQENSFPGLLGNVAAGRIASRLDLGGTNCVVDAACASSLAAIHLAGLELATGRSDMVITGGVDTFNDIFMYMCFSKTPALSPTGDAKPFSQDCDGTVLGEGLGMLVLKRLEDAERDGDRIYAVLKGTASSSDGRSSAIYAPRADGQKLALQRAYEISGVKPESIGLLEAHGTGTKVGDATELSSLTEVFRAANQPGSWCALGSVKSQIGHTKAAAGVAGIIKAAMALHQKVLPPSIKVSQPLEGAAPGLSPFYVNTIKRPWLPSGAHPRRAGVSALGFGGTNFHCVLEEHGSNKPAVDWDGDVEILAFSNDSLGQLKDQIAAHDAKASWPDFRRAAWDSRQQFRLDGNFRLLVAVNKDSDRIILRDTALRMLESNPDKASWMSPTGIVFGSGKPKGKIGALFPGQGSQYVGMLRDLACQFPAMLNALTAAQDVFAGLNGKTGDPQAPVRGLSEFIYPHPAFSKDALRQQEDALKSTDIAQPALGAVSVGALDVLTYFGVKAQAVCGHSYGELSALSCAGRIKPEELHRLSNLRGRLMAAKNDGGDFGSMIAVQADEQTVLGFLRESGAGAGGMPLVMANRNSPKQFVLAGPTAGIETAAQELASRSIRATILPVSAAFHSSLVADAREPFAQALEAVAIAEGEIPVYANSTGQVYPKDSIQARDVLANQIVQPVNFMDQILAMADDGVRTFVEVGPGHVLCDLVQAILPGGDVEAIALDASKGKRSGIFDLALALSRIASLGHQVNLTQWENVPTAAEAGAKKSALKIALTGANYRAPHLTRAPAKPVARAALDAIRPDERVRHDAGINFPDRSVESKAAQQLPPQSEIMQHSSKTTDPDVLSSAFRAAKDGIIALQRLQEQTAQLHKQFLEGQESARRAIQSLLGLQGGMTHQGLPAQSPSTVSTGIAVSESQSLQPLKQASREPLGALADQPAPNAVVQNRSGSLPAGATASAAPDRSRYEQAVLQVVSDKTGYPVEMLTLDMGMDSDLGVDSIKRVEIMATLRGSLPEAPEIKPEHLGSLQTLDQVVAFLAGGASVAPAESIVFGNAIAASAIPISASAVQPVEKIGEAVLSVVADKTGYPVEMLTLDMGMDTDLGIDSIKRVEIMASLRGLLPDAPEIKPEHLGSLQTLEQVVAFLSGGNEQTGTRDAAAKAATTAGKRTAIPIPPSGFSSLHVSQVLLAVVAEKTGYPAEMLNLDMGMDSDLGIDSIKRVEIMASLRTQLPGSPEIKPEQLGSLQTLQQIVDFLAGNSGIAMATSVAEMIAVDGAPAADALPGEGANQPAGIAESLAITQSVVNGLNQAGSNHADQDPVVRQVVRKKQMSSEETRDTIGLPKGALVWLTDDGSLLSSRIEGRLRAKGLNVLRGDINQKGFGNGGALPAALVIVAPAAGSKDSFLRQSFRLMQLASPSLRRAGMGQQGRAAGRSIFVTISRLDGAFGFDSLGDKADLISGGLAGLVKTAHREWPEVHCKAIDLNPENLQIEEAAEEIVAEIFRAGPLEVGLSGRKRVSLEVVSVPLRATSSGAISLLNQGDVVIISGGARGVTGEAALELAKAFRPTLVLLGRSELAESEPVWLQDLNSEAEIKKALFARAEGNRSPKTVEAKYIELLARREIRTQIARLEAAGARAIYRAVDVRDGLAVSGVISEIRLRHGAIRGLIHGAGVLADRRIEDKTDEQFESVYGTKVAGLQNLLGAIAGEELKAMVFFSSYTGRYGRVGQVDYAAANEVLNKIAQSEARGRRGCRVLSVNWGPWNGGMVTPGLRKIFEAEGVGLIEPADGAEFLVRELLATDSEDVEVLAIARPTLTVQSDDSHPPQDGTQNDSSPRPGMFASGNMPALGESAIAFEREVSVRALPCLESHVLNGRAVLPAALMVEWLAQAALHGNPGMAFHGLDNFKVLKGLVLEADQSVNVSLHAGEGLPRANLLAVAVRMSSRSGGRLVLHAEAEVLLTTEKLPVAPAPALNNVSDGGFKDAYTRGVLFHGADLHGIQSVEGCTEQGVAATVRGAPSPRKWIRNPLRGTWIADPLALDSAFQMMILWSSAHRAAPSLPSALARYRQFVSAFPKSGCRVVIGVALGISAMAVATIEFLDSQGNLLAAAEGCECVVDASLSDAFRLNRLGLEK